MGIVIETEKHFGIGDICRERAVGLGSTVPDFLIGIIFGEHEFLGEIIFDIKLYRLGRFCFFIEDTFGHSFHGIDFVVERFQFDEEGGSDIEHNERHNDPDDIREIGMITEHREKEHEQNG